MHDDEFDIERYAEDRHIDQLIEAEEERIIEDEDYAILEAQIASFGKDLNHIALNSEAINQLKVAPKLCRVAFGDHKGYMEFIVSGLL